ncbi:hypothetical protein PIB30_054788 [Stylosanthes scabra]|uniref:Neprosin PEP catalytic domain-containing protein n=1 Tax=Stylosanthes scabra TaxID=79078 RepID=A0ABU6SJH4_9FABA|nr:hypothetical protein [Stylosanthes scabra]
MKRITTSNSQIEDFGQLSQDYPGHHYASVQTTTTGKTYYGASASISFYNLSLGENQYSLSHIFVQSGPSSELNSIQAGIGADNFQKTECFDTQCPGYVQIDQTYFLGMPLAPASQIGTEQNHYLPIKLFRVKNKNFGLGDNGENVNVGYWPHVLFNHISEGATFVRYGGETYAPPDCQSPPMGSGRLAEEKFKNAAYVARAMIVDSDYNEDDIQIDDVDVYVDTPSSCYEVLYDGYQGDKYAQAFIFGGPGGNCGV